MVRQLLKLSTLAFGAGIATTTWASDDACLDNWLNKDDAQFAADCADMAFTGSLKDRQTLAWLLFARTLLFREPPPTTLIQ